MRMPAPAKGGQFAASPALWTLTALLLGMLGQGILLKGRAYAPAAGMLFLLGGLLAARVLPRSRPLEIRVGTGVRREPRSPRATAGMLITLCGIGILGWGGWQCFWRWDAVRMAWRWYLAGGLIVLAGTALWDGYRPLAALRHIWAARRDWAGEAVAVTIVMMLAFAVTLAGLDDFPPTGGISWNDEAQMGKDAYSVLHHDGLPWQYPTSVYPVVLSFILFGPTTFALRLPFAVMGALTCLPLYFLARRLLGPAPALATAFLFAVSRYRIALSRLALPVTPDMLCALIALACLARALHTRGKAPCFAAGLSLALGLYSHASFKLVPLVSLMLLGIAAVRRLAEITRMSLADRRPAVWQSLGGHLPGLVIFLLALALFAAPYFGFVHREPQIALTERFTSVLPALFQPTSADVHALAPRLLRALLFYNLEGESWPAANLPGTPALDPITGVLFALGLVMATASFWRGWNALLVFWFLAVFIGGGVLPAEFRSHRIALAMPAVYLLAGLFVQQLWHSWQELAPRLRSFTAGLLGLLLLSAAFVNLGIFFGQQARDPRTRAEFDRDISALANILAGFRGQRYIYLMANFPFYNPGQDFAWLAGEPPGRRIMSLTEALPSREDTSLDLLYAACLPYDRETLAAAVRAFYPGAQELSLESPYGRYACRLLLVDGKDAAARRGLTLHFLSTAGGTNSTYQTIRVPALEVEWGAADIPHSPPFRVQWEGALYVPAYDTYVIRTMGSVPVGVWVDGQPADGSALRLAEGWHTLRAAGQVERVPAVVSLWWRSGDEDWEKVPPAYLDASADIPGIDVVFSACDGGGASDGPAWQRVAPLIALQTVPSEWEGAPAKALAGRPYCAVYEGWIRVDQAGRYGFCAAIQAGGVRLLLDGRPVLEDAGQPRAKIALEGEVPLTPGWHALRLEYRRLEGEFSGVTLYWRAPAGEWVPVPPTALSRAPGGEIQR